MSAADYRDLVIETLADSEAALLHRLTETEAAGLDAVVALRCELSGWQALAREAIHALHEREMQIRQLRASVRMLREERRRTCPQRPR